MNRLKRIGKKTKRTKINKKDIQDWKDRYKDKKNKNK